MCEKSIQASSSFCMYLRQREEQLSDAVQLEGGPEGSQSGYYKGIIDLTASS